jgi:ribosomal protein S18 acetylase RimI-like enzyme
METQIITAKPHHAPAISYLGRIAFRAAFGHLFNKKIELEEYLDYTYSVEKIACSLKKENNIYFLALVDGLPAGFAKVKRHSLNEQLDSFSQAELQKLYVLQQFHGKGVADALLQAILEFTSSIEAECLWLDTHVSNERAIRFYEKHGFKKEGTAFFTIGTQTFEYYVFAMPIQITQPC